MGCIKTLLEQGWEQFKSIIRAKFSQLSMLSWEQFKSIIQWLFDLNWAQFKSIIHPSLASILDLNCSQDSKDKRFNLAWTIDLDRSQDGIPVNPRRTARRARAAREQGQQVDPRLSVLASRADVLWSMPVLVRKLTTLVQPEHYLCFQLW